MQALGTDQLQAWPCFSPKEENPGTLELTSVGAEGQISKGPWDDSGYNKKP